MDLRVRSWRRSAARASRMLSDGHVPAAVKEYQRAASIARRTADPVHYAIVLHNLARARIHAGDGPVAREELREACELLRHAPGGTQFLATALRALGSLEVELGDLVAARHAHEEAVEVCKATGDREGLARAHVDLGIALKDADRLTDARAYLADGLAAAREDGADDIAGHALTGIGLIHEQLNELEQAAACYQEALSAYERVGDEANIATVHHNLGVLLDRGGQATRAMEHFRRSYEIDKARGDLPSVAADMSAVASMALALGETERAESIQDLALRLHSANGHRRGMISTLVDSAIIARDRGEPERAQAGLAEAARLAEQSADASELYQVHLIWGDILAAHGDRSAAREHYVSAAAAMQSLRPRLLREEEVLAYFDDNRLMATDRIISVSAELGDVPACLHWVEHAKGRELARRMATVPLPPPRRAPEELALREVTAAATVRALSAELADVDQVTPARVANLVRAERELRETWAEIGRFDPDFAALRGDDTPSWEELTATAAEASANDGRDVLIVQYYVNRDSTLVLGIAPGREPMMATVPRGAAQVGRLVSGLATAVDSPAAGGAGSGAWQESAAPLTDPIREWSSTGDVVYLCPHDALHRVPLHAVERDGVSLGERNIVAYTPSVSVLRSCLARRVGVGTRRRALVLGDGDGRTVFARDEALAVTEVLQANGIDTDLSIGEQATGRVLSEALAAESVDVLHLAAHGSFDRATPMESGIELADGLLTAARIMPLPLNAGLVVLSACESGVAARRAGDELLGLVRALMYAGTPSVLATMWRVGQISPSLLMQAFYRELVAGAPKGIALWRAQREVRRLTAEDLVAYFVRARERVGDDPGARAFLDLAEAAVCLWARDVAAARKICDELASRTGLTEAQRAQTDRLRRRASRGTGADRPEPDYGVRPYDSIRNWAPFVLIGDWR
jgi:CHAT domain-containing protein/tetratricopeptide (TPR) repeat protein